MFHFPGDGFRLVDLFRSVGAAVHLEQTDNVRIDQLDEINDLTQVTIGTLQITAEGNRKMKTSANTCTVTDVV